MKAEFTVAFYLKLSLQGMDVKPELNLTFEEVEVKVIDKEDENRFLEISSVGPDSFKVKIITSTEALSKILNVAGGWEKPLRQRIDS